MPNIVFMDHPLESVVTAAAVTLSNSRRARFRGTLKLAGGLRA